MHRILSAILSAKGALCSMLLTVFIGASMTSPVRADEQHDGGHGDHNASGMHDHSGHGMHKHSMPEQDSYAVSVATYSAPELSMVDSNGNKVAMRELLDDRVPIFLNFIYTSCTTICPVMSATFQQVQAKLGRDRQDVHLVSISIDPENDTPARLATFAAKYQAGPEWTFVTGTLEDSLAMQKAFGVFAGEKMSHKSITFIKTKGSKAVWARIEGLAGADRIIKEYDKLRSGK